METDITVFVVTFLMSPVFVVTFLIATHLILKPSVIHVNHTHFYAMQANTSKIITVTSRCSVQMQTLHGHSKQSGSQVYA